ncbi:tyrosine-protein phosphatase [Novosphingobium sp. M1R2S20]|uniref:Tyrosine-protein phosphatase n=1 Tax=Novosphingobium rhizovicinum TaxID=3228928 RepID=A0ABV3RFT4_9SPHN
MDTGSEVDKSGGRMSEDRVLALEGVHNFRDYGGYSTAGGGRLRRGVLWRSGQHHGASEADLERIGSLGLVAVFDLRSHRERASHPCRRPASFAARVVHAPDPAEHSAPHIAAARVTRQRTAESTREGLLQNYTKIAFRPELQAMMAQLITAVASGEGPTLVNCMAGKDRTGLAVAMVQFAAGVHRDDVLEDYLLTNTAGDVEARIAAGAATIRTMAGEIDEAALRVLMGVEAEYLETALLAIEAEYGSLDSYMSDALGAGPAVCAKLRDAVVA